MSAEAATVATVAPRRPSTVSDHRQRILRVLVHLQQNLDEPLNVEQLARVAALSLFHFHRVFRGIVGESVMDHVRRLRLERAARHLRFTDAPVVTIALAAGYDAHEAFTRAFHATFSVSPSEFRKRRPVRAGAGDDLPGVGELRPPLSPRAARRLAEVRLRPPARVAFVHHVGPYAEVGAAWRQLMEWARTRPIPPDARFGLSYDDPDITPPERVRYDACLEVDAAVMPEGEIGVREIAGGEFAVALHKGAYARLGETYAALVGVWAPATGRTLGDGPSLERYLNDPRVTPPDELLTEIWLGLSAPAP